MISIVLRSAFVITIITHITVHVTADALMGVPVQFTCAQDTPLQLGSTILLLSTLK